MKRTEIDQIDDILYTMDRLKAEVLNLKGVLCITCGGVGRYSYGDCSTWRRGGVCGQMITDDVCDKCWGTGRTDRKGADLKKIDAEIRSLKLRIGGD